MAAKGLQISQDEARRRLRAGLALRGMTFTDLAANSGFSEGTWVSAGGDRLMLERHARDAARALELPYEWFSAPDINDLLENGAAAARAAAATELAEGDRRAGGDLASEVDRRLRGADLDSRRRAAPRRPS